MTTDVQGVPAQRAPGQKASGRRRLAGLGIGIGVLVLVAYPVVVYAFSALVFFVGWDTDPEPMRGAYRVVIVLFLLALPLIAGLVTAGVLRARIWRVALAAAVLIGWWLTRGIY